MDLVLLVELLFQILIYKGFYLYVVVPSEILSIVNKRLWIQEQHIVPSLRLHQVVPNVIRRPLHARRVPNSIPNVVQLIIRVARLILRPIQVHRLPIIRISLILLLLFLLSIVLIIIILVVVCGT